MTNQASRLRSISFLLALVTAVCLLSGSPSIGDTPSPDEIREAQKQGIEHADREFEQAKLKQSLKDRGVNPDNPDQFKQEKTKLDDKQQAAQQGKGPQLTPEDQKLLDDMNRLTDVTNMINGHNNAVKLFGPNKEMEDAAQARRLQIQAEQLRKSGLGPQADALEKAAQQLYGGPLPPLHQGTAGATGTRTVTGTVEGEVVDPSWKPLGWILMTGARIFERPEWLNDPNRDQELRDKPLDGSQTKSESDAGGKFKIGIDYQFQWSDKLKLGPTYDYLQPPASTDIPKTQPDGPKTPPKESSGSTQGAMYRTGAGERDSCTYAWGDTPFGDAWLSGEPLTIKAGRITLSTELGYNFQVTKGTQLSVVYDALNAVNIPRSDFTFDQHVTDGIGGIGHVQAAWAAGRDFQWKIPDHIVGAEEEVCSQIAPAPSWDPAHWPARPATGLPVFHMMLRERHD